MKRICAFFLLAAFFVSGFAICLTEEIQSEEAWNWQVFEHAEGAGLNKAQKAVTHVRRIGEDELPRFEDPAVKIMGERVLLHYRRPMGYDNVFVYSVNGSFLYGYAYKPSYNGIEAELSPYKEGVYLLDWRFWPGPTVICLPPDEGEIRYYICDGKYQDYPRVDEYKAYYVSDSVLLEKDNGGVAIRNPNQQVVRLFDDREGYRQYLQSVERGRKETAAIVRFFITAVAVAGLCLAGVVIGKRIKRVKANCWNGATPVSFTQRKD